MHHIIITMADNADETKEKRRRKQHKKMGKILGQVCDWDESFQERTNDEKDANDGDDNAVVLCLTDIGQKVDSKSYRIGRHGWEDFARDLGGVYHRHVKG